MRCSWFCNGKGFAYAKPQILPLANRKLQPCWFASNLNKSPKMPGSKEALPLTNGLCSRFSKRRALHVQSPPQFFLSVFTRYAASSPVPPAP